MTTNPPWRTGRERDAAYLLAISLTLAQDVLIGAHAVLEQSLRLLQSHHPQAHQVRTEVHQRRLARALLILLKSGLVRARIERGLVTYRNAQAPGAAPVSTSARLYVPVAVTSVALVAGCAFAPGADDARPRYSYFVGHDAVAASIATLAPMRPPVTAKTRDTPIAAAIDARSSVVASSSPAPAASPASSPDSAAAATEPNHAPEHPAALATVTASTRKSVYFASGRAALGLDAMQTLRGLLPLLAEASTVTVVGSADPSGDPAQNEHLAHARARAVTERLTKLSASAGLPRIDVATSICDHCWINPGKIRSQAELRELRRVDIEIRHVPRPARADRT